MANGKTSLADVARVLTAFEKTVTTEWKGDAAQQKSILMGINDARLALQTAVKSESDPSDQIICLTDQIICLPSSE